MARPKTFEGLLLVGLPAGSPLVIVAPAPCPGCGSSVIEKHNRACAATGERSYVTWMQRVSRDYARQLAADGSAEALLNG